MRLLLRGLMFLLFAGLAAWNFEQGGVLNIIIGIVDVLLAFYWGARFITMLDKDD